MNSEHTKYLKEMPPAHNSQMLYQTIIRNVALFLSVALAFLAISRFYRGKDMFMYNVVYILIGMMFSITSFFLAFYLDSDFNKYMEITDKETAIFIKKWHIFPKLLVFSNVIFLLLAIYTLFRQFNVKNKK